MSIAGRMLTTTKSKFYMCFDIFMLRSEFCTGVVRVPEDSKGIGLQGLRLILTLTTIATTLQHFIVQTLVITS